MNRKTIVNKAHLYVTQSINNLFDMDDAYRKRLLTLIGFIVTLFTLRSVEIRLRTLFVYLATFRPTFLLFAFVFTFAICYLLIRYEHLIFNAHFLANLVQRRNLLVMFVLIFFAYIVYSQFYTLIHSIMFWSKAGGDVVVVMPIAYSTINHAAPNVSIPDRAEHETEFDHNFRRMIVSLSRKITRSKSNSSCVLNFNRLIDKVNTCNTFDVQSEAFKLYNFLNRSLVEPEPELETETHSNPDSSLFTNLLDFWKYMIKTFLSTIVLLTLIYLIVRVLFESLLSSNENFNAHNNDDKSKSNAELTSSLYTQNKFSSSTSSLTNIDKERKPPVGSLIKQAPGMSVSAFKSLKVSQSGNLTGSSIEELDENESDYLSQTTQTPPQRDSLLQLHSNSDLASNQINQTSTSTPLNNSQQDTNAPKLDGLVHLVNWLFFTDPSNFSQAKVDIDYTQIMNKLFTDNFQAIKLKVS